MEQVKSPCKGVCLYEDTEGICRCCGRTAQEIEEWPSASRDRKVEITKESRRRRKERKIEKYKKEVN